MVVFGSFMVRSFEVSAEEEESNFWDIAVEAILSVIVVVEEEDASRLVKRLLVKAVAT